MTTTLLSIIVMVILGLFLIFCGFCLGLIFMIISLALRLLEDDQRKKVRHL